MAVLDLVALSFVSVHRWRLIVDQLRAGLRPDQILEAECLIPPRTGRPRRTPSELRERAARAIDRGTRAGLTALCWNDPRTPPSFLQIVDPPPVLWVRGQLSWIDQPSVGIVGSRAGSPYAIAVAERLASDLAARGVVIVSGLARGVDAAAHQGALAAAGLTVAVLGCGADRVYPHEHKALAQRVATDGALVSEFAPCTPPTAVFFPRRNRIIAALSQAVVVVEAGEKSGSLITARCALEQNRDVLAVPGNILTARNRGGHALLRDGARLVESADDVLEQLGLSGGATTGLQPPENDPVLAVLPPGEPFDLDQLSEQTGLATPHLLARLLDLELRGNVRRSGGGRFVRA